MLLAVKGQELNVTLQGQTTLTTAKEFGNILLRVNPDGAQGDDLVEATLTAARLRLRPILMTSLAFILALQRRFEGFPFFQLLHSAFPVG